MFIVYFINVKSTGSHSSTTVDMGPRSQEYPLHFLSKP